MITMSTRRMALLLSVLMLFALLTACGQPAEDATEQETVGTSNVVEETVGAEPAEETDSFTSLRVGSTSNRWVNGLDPQNWNSSASFPVWYLCYDPIVYVDPDTQEMKSDILEEWYYENDDLSTLYLKINPNVTFSNGEPLEAEDIIYSIYRLQASGNYSDRVADVKLDNCSISEDGTTIAIDFGEPYAPGIHCLRMVFIANKSWIAENGGDDNFDYFDPSLVCGTGAYRVSDFVTDTSITFEKREDWWNAENERDDFCQADEITVCLYSDATTMMIDFENGAIDLVMGITADDIARFDSGEVSGMYEIVENNDVYCMSLAVESSPIMENITLRKAICHAIDTEMLTQTVYGMLGKTATSVLPSSMKDYYVAGHSYEYNPELAKQYLAEYLAEVGQSEVQLVSYVANDVQTAQLGEMIQYYLNEVGIAVDLQVVEKSTLIPVCREEGTTDYFLVNNLSGAPDLDPLLGMSTFSASAIFPACRHTEEEISEIFHNSVYAESQEARSEAYSQMQDYFYDNYQIVPIVELSSAYCYNTDIISDCKLLSTFEPDLRYITPAN